MDDPTKQRRESKVVTTYILIKILCITRAHRHALTSKYKCAHKHNGS